MNWENAHRWIEQLNTKGYAGPSRLEATYCRGSSVITGAGKSTFFLPNVADTVEYYKLSQSDHPQERNQSPLLKDKKGRFFDPVFEKTQGWIWTGDSYYRLNAAWRIDYFKGLVDWDVYYYIFYFVRPVRTLE